MDQFLCDVPCITPSPVCLVEEEEEDDREHERQNDNIKTVEITSPFRFFKFEVSMNIVVLKFGFFKGAHTRDTLK
jgi:hypothetical protein